jgi:hypothetical protein
MPEEKLAGGGGETAEAEDNESLVKHKLSLMGSVRHPNNFRYHQSVSGYPGVSKFSSPYVQ